MIKRKKRAKEKETKAKRLYNLGVNFDVIDLSIEIGYIPRLYLILKCLFHSRQMLC